MSDEFSQIKERLSVAISSLGHHQPAELSADPWIISSLLQKAIRRGDVEIAQRAALCLFAVKSSSIWRRFMVIAFEDVGVGSPVTLATIVAACTDAKWRKTAGGGAVVVVYLARLLAEAPKDRSADYLICGASQHPCLAQERQALATSSISERLRIVADVTRTLPHRAVGAWYASGIDWTIQGLVCGGNLAALLQTFRELGVPNLIVEATELAARRTRESIVVMVPLVWLAANDGRSASVAEVAVPASARAEGVPLYALDKHTRVGREAIWRFASQSDEVRVALNRYLPPGCWRDAAYMAAFYVDAVPVGTKFVWTGSDDLETFGMEADMHKVGVPLEGIQPLLEAFQNNLDHLNAIRAEVFVRSRKRSGAVQGSLALGPG